MPRNPSGTFTLAESPFVPSTPISSTAVNSDLSDIADGLTDSLSRSGDGGMTAELALHVDGFSYSGDSDTGMSRSVANTQIIECGGVDVVTVTTTGASVAGTLDATTVKQNGFALIPIGVILPFAASSAPIGYLLCYGQAVSRTTYAALFAIIGTAYGVGDGSTTFNVPDLRGRAIAGSDVMGGVGAGRLTPASGMSGLGIGAVSGNNQTVTLVANQIPSLTSVNAAQAISVTNTYQVPVQGTAFIDSLTQGAGGAVLFWRISPNSGTQVVPSSGNNSISVSYTNASLQAVTNVQPTILVNYIIYAGA